MTRVNLERWRQHLEAARIQGIPLAHYAKANGLSRYALYAASKAIRKAEQMRTKADAQIKESASPFVTVQVAAPLSALRAELPNGVILQCSPANTTDVMNLIQVLAALPCSR